MSYEYLTFAAFAVQKIDSLVDRSREASDSAVVVGVDDAAVLLECTKRYLGAVADGSVQDPTADWPGESLNLVKSRALYRERQELKGVQDALKAAFKGDELDGGWRAALSHPLYLKIEGRLAEIDEELKGLI